MRFEVAIPLTADGSLAVTITNWLKQVGEPVKKGADLVEATTEKITLYVSSPAEGTLTEILLKKGEKAAVGQVIGYVEGG